MKSPYQAFAVARFDGSVMFNDYRIGVTLQSGRGRALVVLFKILAGNQYHPLYALDELAIRVYAYCKTAADRNLRPTQLGASVTASPLSNESTTTLVLTHIEWHTDADTRNQAELLFNRLRVNDEIQSWPNEVLDIPIGFK